MIDHPLVGTEGFTPLVQLSVGLLPEGRSGIHRDASRRPVSPVRFGSSTGVI